MLVLMSCIQWFTGHDKQIFIVTTAMYQQTKKTKTFSSSKILNYKSCFSKTLTDEADPSPPPHPFCFSVK